MHITQDDNEVFNYYIRNRLKPNNTEMSNIELMVRPNCNLSCEYCYLTLHGRELYPEYYCKTVPNEQILNNIKTITDFLIQENIYENHWELFAGDLFYDNLWFNIMDILYDYFETMKSMNIIPVNKFDEDVIELPNNCSFCQDDNKMEKVQEYIYKFKREINVNIFLSYSTDGKYATNVREKHEVSDELYDKIFKFLVKNNFGCHPMISYESIDNAIKNYDWWIEQYKKYFIPNNKDVWVPALFEVRNDGWNEESIQKYLDLLQHMINYRFSLCNNDIHTFTSHLFSPQEYLKENNILARPKSMDPLTLYILDKDNNYMSCSLSRSICIKCDDLSILPCHRLGYSFFRGGHLIKKGDQIKLEAYDSVNAYLHQVLTNNNYQVGCATCENNLFCTHGCHGAQFEYSKEPNAPIPSICLFYNSKINFLINTYHKMGVFDDLFQRDNLDMDLKLQLIEFLKVKGYNEYEYKYL